MFSSPYSRAALVKAQLGLFEPPYMLVVIVLCFCLANDILDHYASFCGIHLSSRHSA